MDKCNCTDSIQCYHCERKNEKAENKKVLDNWSWNYSPKEAAMEAIRLGWSNMRVRRAMAENGYRDYQIKSVLLELGGLG